MKKEKYHISIRILHWLMALMIISLLIVGFYMKGIDKELFSRGIFYHFHKSFGVVVLFLVAIRIFFRLIKSTPPLPEAIPDKIKKLAHRVHYLLYLLMFIMPLSGYLMSNFYGYRVRLFDVKMPYLVEKNVELGAFFAKTHQVLGFVFVFVITLHVLGVIKHRFFDEKENDVLPRMT